MEIRADVTDDDRVHIRVIDEGVGIAPDAIGPVLQPFTQVADSQTGTMKELDLAFRWRKPSWNSMAAH